MNTEHIPEVEIQQYSIAASDCTGATHAHILSCDQCRQRAEEYKQVFEGIKKLEKPRFKIELVELVLPQLVPAKPPIMIPVMWIYIMVAVPVTCLMVYLFSTNLAGLLVGMTPVIFGLLITTILSIAGFISIDAYLHFKKKMHQLNYF